MPICYSSSCVPGFSQAVSEDLFGKNPLFFVDGVNRFVYAKNNPLAWIDPAETMCGLPCTVLKHIFQVLKYQIPEYIIVTSSLTMGRELRRSMGRAGQSTR